MPGRLRLFSSVPRLTRLEDRIAPAVATWDGGGADNNWTTAANWVGDVAPHPGDDLVFPASAARQTNINDFPAGTAFGSIRLDGQRYVITGNAITLAAGIIANSQGDPSDPKFGPDITARCPSVV